MEIKFGTSGWRAIIGDDFTFDNVQLVTSAIAKYIKEEVSRYPAYAEASAGRRHVKVSSKKLSYPKVIVGYDSRFMSEDFALECAKVLIKFGIQPFLTREDTPTPVIAYEIIRRKADGGVNFTASHNPYEYNGIKFSPSYGGPAFSEITNQIEKNIKQGFRNFKKIEKIESLTPKYIDPKDKYIKRIKELVDLKKLHNLKVVADPLYGTGRHYLKDILQIADCKFKIIHDWRDVRFGGGRPEPDTETLKELSKNVVLSSANIGISTDGDADRFGIIDADGTYYNPNAVITLLLYHLYKTRGWKNVVVRTVATTHMIDAICKKYGLEVIETPVGFKYIAKIMQEKDILIGGEESGGLTIHGHIPEKDGILAGLLMAEMVATEKKTIGEIMHNLYKEFGLFLSNRINLKLTTQMDKILKANLSRSIKEIAGLKVLKKITIDGTKFLLEDGSWILFRFSGTEPVVRIYGEANSKKKLNAILNAGQRLAE